MGSSCSSGPKKDRCSKKKKSHETNGGNHSQRGSNASAASVYMIATCSEPSSEMAGPFTKSQDVPAQHEKPRVERVDSHSAASVSSPMSPNQLLTRQASREGATTGEIEVGRIDLQTLRSDVRSMLMGSELRRLAADGKVTVTSTDDVREKDVYRASHRCVTVVLSRYDAVEYPEEILTFEESVLGPLKKVCLNKSYEVDWLVLEKNASVDDWGFLCDESQSPLTFVLLVTSESSPPNGEEAWNWLTKKVISNPNLRRRTLVIWKRLLQSPFDTTELQQKLLETMDEARILKCNCKFEGEDARSYLEIVKTHLWTMMAPMVDMALEGNERTDPTALNQPQFIGLSRCLYLELVNQFRLAQSFLRWFVSDLWPQDFLRKIDDYVWGEEDGVVEKNRPLVLHGASGKSALMAHLAYRLANSNNTAHLVFRIIAHRQQTSFLSLFNNLIEQCCLLLAQPKPNSIQAADLPGLLGRIAPPNIPLVVLLDGLDCVVTSSSPPFSFEWLPTTLPDNVRLIITVDDSSPLHGHLTSILPLEAFHQVPSPLPTVACNVVNARLRDKQIILNENQQLVCDDAVRQNLSVSYMSMITSSVTVFLQGGKLTPSSPISSLSSSSSSLSIKVEPSLEMQATLLLESLEKVLELSFVKSSLSLLLTARCGLSGSELARILTPEFTSLHPLQIIKSTRYLFSWLEPVLVSLTVLQGTVLYTLNCPHFRTAIRKRYLEADDALQLQVRRRLKEFWATRENLTRKSAEAIEDRSLPLDPHLFLQKLKHGSVEDFMDQLKQASIENFDQSEVDIFVNFLNEIYQVLKYDGGQLFTQVHGHFSLPNKPSLILKKMLDKSAVEGAPCNSLLSPVGPGALRLENVGKEEDVEEEEEKTEGVGVSGGVITIHCVKDNPGFMVSLNASKNEVTVWDVFEQRAVRTLSGIPQPRDIKFIDDHRALILCNRELCIYDLDTGAFQVKLKGVMNQKMAFYGLHDSEHVVALSRNRMYVNMMNLSSGDCVATFKVGEDRFLNSLLVSADGSICVCGDETQKPFPLLVWDLASRKLMYDLRIPHHDFVTSLSAITSDGHYVICVCQEVGDPLPNFVIVYDLQNGTLFKKWKPEVSTCSVAISSEGGCAITGLTNTSLLEWDLITGACRFTLVGHTAPVTCIQLNETGQRCLTADLPRCRDPAIRLWDLTKGLCLASFASAESHISSCQLSLDGTYAVVSLGDRPTILTLVWVEAGSSVDNLKPAQKMVFGRPENDGKSVDFGKA